MAYYDATASKDASEPIPFWVGERPGWRYVFLKAFIDESGTHADSPVVVMGAVLGDLRQWKLFDRKLKRLRADFGFNIFHSKDFRKAAGEFSGWSDEKRGALLGQFNTLVATMAPLCVFLPTDRYNREYKQKYAGGKVGLDSQYGVCFRHITARIISDLKVIPGPHLVHFIVESGHKNRGELDTIFDSIKAEAKRQNIAVTPQLTISDKESSLPLMAADYVAFINYKMECERLAGIAPEGGPGGGPTIFSTHVIGLIEGGLDLHQENVGELKRRDKADRRRAKSSARRSS